MPPREGDFTCNWSVMPINMYTVCTSVGNIISLKFTASGKHFRSGKYVSEYLVNNLHCLNIPMSSQVLDPFGQDDPPINCVTDICNRLQKVNVDSLCSPKTEPQTNTGTLLQKNRYFVIDHSFVCK